MWTAEQKQAIGARGGSLLVSAAAGSGKTAVLVERVVGLILDERSPVDADRLLVVTFSNAAADEMRQRVAARLREEAAARPDDTRLLRQQMLLDNAHISTIHAFCLELLREHFHLLGLPADFRVADEQELGLLLRQALRETIDKQYSEDGAEEFSRLVELISTSRNDNKVESVIRRLYDFIRSHPFYEEWLDEKRAMYDAAIPVEESVWGRAVLDYALSGVEHAMTLTGRCLELMEDDEPMRGAYAPAFEQDLAALGRLRAALEDRDWDGACALLNAYRPAKIGSLRGYADLAKKQHVQDCRKQTKELMEGLRTRQFCATRQEHREDLLDLAPKIKALFQVVKEFGRRLDELKEAKKLVDFADLEHFAIRLLVEREGREGLQRTPIARALSERIEEVLVDEFQDTNAAQDLIFRAVSRGEENLFMVGDVKQSIYRFRQAMPEIFLEKRGRSHPYNGQDWPARIVLGRNFRSRDTVTAGVNYLFGMLMSRELGEIDYNAQEALIPGADYPPATGLETQLHILDASRGGGQAARVEADYLAGQIQELLDSRVLVGRGEARRAIQPGDICLLLRSPKNRAGEYLEAMKRRGIPAYSESQRGFLTTEEVAAVIALLRVADNPLLDLPLAEALASPLFGLDADHLAAVRLEARHKPLYQAVQAAAGRGDRDCQYFLEVLEELRRAAASLPADRLVTRLYERTDFLRLVRVMEQGEQRAANLRLLVGYARDYERRGFRGLSGFVRFICRVMEQGGDLVPASVQAMGAVSVMSVHRAKGLEFPVVFLADLDKPFNRQELYGSTLLHSRLGFACKRRDKEQLRQFSTVPLEAIRLESDRAMLSEELRILYVALTRAQERLFLVASLKNPDKALASLQAPLEEGKLSPWTVRRGASYFDWIAMALLHHPGGRPMRERLGLGGEGVTAAGQGAGGFVVKYALPPCPEAAAAQELAPALPPPEPGEVEGFLRNAAFRYPYGEDVVTPAKFAISEIAHPQNGGLASPRRPAFLDGEAMSAAQRGIATHKFMQFADFERAEADLTGELQRLIEARFLSPEEAGAVELERVAPFFKSALARRMKAALAVYREYRFIAEADNPMLGDDCAGGPARRGRPVLQGIADCVFVERGGAVVIDYKTDRVKSPQDLIERYTPQLTLYGTILGEYLETPVRECWVYSFALGEEIRII